MLLFGFLELVQVYVWSADLWHVFVCTLHRVRWRVVSFKQAKYFESFLPHWICEWLNMEQKKSNLFNLIVQANLQMTMRTEKKNKQIELISINVTTPCHSSWSLGGSRTLLWEI